MKRAAIYLRVSTRDQSNEIQRIELESFAASRGFQVVRTYEDKATGTNANRPQFQEMLKTAKRREFDILLVWKLDRFARSLKDLVTHLNEFGDLGIEFVSIRDQIDLTTSSGRLMMHLLASFAEFEASLIKERVRAGIENAKCKGTRLGRPRISDPVKIASLRSQGLSLSAIATHLGISKTSVHKTLAQSSFINPFTKPEIPGSGVSVGKE